MVFFDFRSISVGAAVLMALFAIVWLLMRPVEYFLDNDYEIYSKSYAHDNKPRNDTFYIFKKTDNSDNIFSHYLTKDQSVSVNVYDDPSSQVHSYVSGHRCVKMEKQSWEKDDLTEGARDYYFRKDGSRRRISYYSYTKGAKKARRKHFAYVDVSDISALDGKECYYSVSR